MSALLLSFLYLFMDSIKTDLGAGDLAVEFGNTGLSKSVDYAVTHKLHTDIYNDLTNASLPAFSLKIPDFYFTPNSKNIYILKGVDYQFTLNLLSDFKNLLPESIRNYHYLWHIYIKGESKVQIFCQFTKIKGCKDYKDFIIPTSEISKTSLMAIKKNNSRGILLEEEVFGPPCGDDKLVKTFKLENLCDFMKAISKKPLTILSIANRAQFM